MTSSSSSSIFKLIENIVICEEMLGLDSIHHMYLPQITTQSTDDTDPGQTAQSNKSVLDLHCLQPIQTNSHIPFNKNLLTAIE